MKRSSPSLLPIFRSRGMAAILQVLFVGPEDPALSVSELARRSGMSVATAHREVDLLEFAGLVASHRVGRSRVVRPNSESPLHDDLRSLLRKALGPPAVLREELGDIVGLEAAYLFGSWAAALSGEPIERPPIDIDVLVVGNVDPEDVYGAARAAEQRLGHLVDALVVSHDEWEAEAGAIATIRARPIISILGHLDP